LSLIGYKARLSKWSQKVLKTHGMHFNGDSLKGKFIITLSTNLTSRI